MIEREGPWRRPQDFFPAYDDAVFEHHLPSMAPEFYDAALGLMNITYDTFVVRTPKYTILVDTCTGEDKGHPPPFDFPGKERWRNELFALGISFDKIDYVFCTHLHIDHTGWNTTSETPTLVRVCTSPGDPGLALHMADPTSLNCSSYFSDFFEKFFPAKISEGFFVVPR